jgi:hypothetical protein
MIQKRLWRGNINCLSPTMSARLAHRALRISSVPRTHRTQQCASSYLRNYFSPKYVRTFSTTRSALAALASHPPSQPSILVFSPSPAQIEEQELDVELIPPEDIKIEITERAAEVLTNDNLLASIHKSFCSSSNCVKYRHGRRTRMLRYE